MKDHKTDTGLMKFLRNGNIFPDAQKLGTYDTTVIGWLTKIHPWSIHYQTLEKEIKSLSAAQLLTP